MSNDSCRTVSQSLQEYGRGVAGGLIFSLPLIFTMEMWWSGFIASPSRLLTGLIGTFLLLLGYNRFAGLRHDATLKEVAVDSIEELGLGLVLAAAILFLLGRISFDMPMNTIIGQIVVETLTVAIGVSVGTAQLGTDAEGDVGMGSDEDSEKQPSFAGQLVLALCGAILFAANIAPTEEIVVLAIENGPERLLTIAVVSLFLAALILNFSEFRGAGRFMLHDGWMAVMRSAIVTYAVALLAATALLWFFGRFDDNALAINLAQIIVLGLPAVLGASAGRLLVQGGSS